MGVHFDSKKLKEEKNGEKRLNGKKVDIKFSEIILCVGIVVEKEEDMLIKYKRPNPLESGIMEKKEHTHTRQLSLFAFFSRRVHYIVVMAGMGSTPTNWHYQLKNKRDGHTMRERKQRKSREQFIKTCKTTRSTEHWPLLISIKSEFYKHTKRRVSGKNPE